jgi:2-dehydro-3-deoxyphosphogluconate aldolase/(4S)-4-hydroxy-2-oxoglutarate aldolase
VFSGTLIETMKGCGRGEKGHIGFHVDDIPRAERYFSEKGFSVDESSRRLNPDGSTFLVYFEEEIGGFAIHLTQG